MAKNAVADWSTTDTLNTDIGGTSIAEGCAPSGINDAIRKVMAQIATWAATLLTSADAAATYLPLSGGALTGGLTGTTASFSTSVTTPSVSSASITATNASNSDITLTPGTSTASGQLQILLGGVRKAYIYQPTTGAGAGTLVFGRDDAGGFSFLGGSAYFGDAQFFLGKSGSDPIAALDGGDYIQYDRANNKYLFYIANALRMSLDASGNLKVVGNITANTTP